MGGPVDRPVFYRGACRVLAQVIVAFPICRWSDRSGREAAAAIRADVVQHVLHAGRAERTFIGADARLNGIGGQRPVAVFTGRPEFKHAESFPVKRKKRAHSTGSRRAGLWRGGEPIYVVGARKWGPEVWCLLGGEWPALPPNFPLDGRD